jgi:hypothetical protein
LQLPGMREYGSTYFEKCPRMWRSYIFLYVIAESRVFLDWSALRQCKTEVINRKIRQSRSGIFQTMAFPSLLVFAQFVRMGIRDCLAGDGQHPRRHPLPKVAGECGVLMRLDSQDVGGSEKQWQMINASGNTFFNCS